MDAAAVVEVEAVPETDTSVTAPAQAPAVEPDVADEPPAAEVAAEAAPELDEDDLDELDEETRERPALVEASEDEVEEAEAEVEPEPDIADPEVEAEEAEPDDTEIDDETRERPAVDAATDDDAPDGDADATDDDAPDDADPREPAQDEDTAQSAAAAATAALAGVASWTRRVATVTGARVGTFSRSTAATVRAATATAAERRAEAAARAEQARRERAAARDLAALEAATASHPEGEAALTFDLVAPVNPAEHVLSVSGLTKSFDDKVAVAGIDLRVHPGDFYGIVGPNGAGKTTTLSMISGLLRPDAGTVHVHGSDVWNDPVAAKRNIGVLPDRLRLFDRLTGAQLLYYAGVLRGLDAPTVKRRTADLARAFGLEEALARLVSDYSAGMTKKIALAAAMIHSPRLLVLDEPFESVDPVSAATVTRILKQYVAAGGTVVLSSHSMDLVQRICDHVAVVVGGVILVDGTIDAVRDGRTLEERFIELAGGRTNVEGLEWLHSFSD